MEVSVHTINSLFEQLGLRSTESEINIFIEKNGPIPRGIELHNAKFWSESQALMLKEMTENDADWAEIVDQLNVRLR